MIRCEICGEPISPADNYYFIEFPTELHRGTHTTCMRKRIIKAFEDCIGTEGDDVGEMVMDGIESGHGMVGIVPDEGEEDGGGHLPPMTEE